jgi:hypothetical protein
MSTHGAPFDAETYGFAAPTESIPIMSHVWTGDAPMPQENPLRQRINKRKKKASAAVAAAPSTDPIKPVTPVDPKKPDHHHHHCRKDFFLGLSKFQCIVLVILLLALGVAIYCPGQSKQQ